MRIAPDAPGAMPFKPARGGQVESSADQGTIPRVDASLYKDLLIELTNFSEVRQGNRTADCATLPRFARRASAAPASR